MGFSLQKSLQLKSIPSKGESRRLLHYLDVPLEVRSYKWLGSVGYNPNVYPIYKEVIIHLQTIYSLPGTSKYIFFYSEIAFPLKNRGMV